MTDPTIATRRKTYREAAAVLTEHVGISQLPAIAAVEAVDRSTALGTRYDHITLEQEHGEWVWLGHYLTEHEDAEVIDKLTIATLELHEALEHGTLDAHAFTQAASKLTTERMAMAYQLDAEQQHERETVELPPRLAKRIEQQREYEEAKERLKVAIAGAIEPALTAIAHATGGRVGSLTRSAYTPLPAKRAQTRNSAGFLSRLQNAVRRWAR